MANLKKIVYLTEAQKNELFTQGTITSNGRTITYNENDIYVTPDKSIDKIIMNGNIHTTVNGTVDLGNVLTPTSGKANNDIIAPVEESSTTTQLYNIDDAFIYNNQLFQTTSTIPTSTIINPGTNCDNVTLLDYIKNICVTKNGTLTNAEQVAIQKMLGIYDPPWELIREDTFTNAEEADHVITLDDNNNSFLLTNVIMWFELPKQTTYAKKGYYGQIHFHIYNSNFNLAPEPGGWEQQADTAAHGFVIVAEQKNGMMLMNSMAQTTYTNSGAMRYRYMTLATQSYEANSGIFLVKDITNTDECYIDQVTIKSVTGTGHYKLYGKRKWT